jgi:hypothetical protein
LVYLTTLSIAEVRQRRSIGWLLNNYSENKEWRKKERNEGRKRKNRREERNCVLDSSNRLACVSVLRLRSAKINMNMNIYIYICIYTLEVVRGSVVVKALCYKPDGRGFETR